MTQDELDELIDLYVDDALPDALRARVEAYLNTHPDAAADAVSLRAIIARLQATPQERPDDWFVERTLNRLLREHQEAQTPLPARPARAG